MNKKGQTGLNTASKFIAVILAVALLGAVAIIVINQIGTTDVTYLSGSSLITNQTETTVTEAGEDLAIDLNILSTSNVIVTNASGGETIAAGNYTITGDVISFSAVQTRYNNTNWNISLGYTFRENKEIGNISLNVSIGIRNFFNNSGTWFSLIAIVVIILIVAIVIAVASRFGGGSSKKTISGEPSVNY